MKKKESFYRSLRFAIRGLALLAKSERNIRIQLAVALVTVAAGFLLGITRYEWITIIVFTGMVIAAEAFNTGMERLIDILHPEWDERVGKIKDITAAAVTVTALAALIAGLIIFLPRVISLLNIFATN